MKNSPISLLYVEVELVIIIILTMGLIGGIIISWKYWSFSPKRAHYHDSIVRMQLLWACRKPELLR